MKVPPDSGYLARQYHWKWLSIYESDKPSSVKE